MEALQCDICGGKLVMGSGGIAVCDSCGMEYKKERIQEKVQEIKGTVRIDNSHMINTWMEQGIKAADAGNQEEAYSYFSKVVELEPQNWRAVFEKGKAAAWQSSLRNLRISELYQAISLALDIIQQSEMESTAVVEAKNEFAVSLFNVNNAITDIMKNNLDSYSELYLDTHFDDIFSLQKRFEANIEKTEDAMALISEYNDDLSVHNVIEMKKRICEDLDSLCGNWQIWIDYSQRTLTYYGYKEIEKQGYIRKAKQVLTDILMYEPDYQYAECDPYDPPPANVMNANYTQLKKVEKYWKQWDQSVRSNITAKKEQAEDLAKRERLEHYWAEHKQEKIELESEYNGLLQQIESIESELRSSPFARRKGTTEAQIERLKSEKESLGLFKNKEKKELQTQIDILNSDLASIDEQINQQSRNIASRTSSLKARAKELYNELTRDR